MPSKHPLAVLRRAADSGIREVVCATSCGKDSVCALSLCCQTFERVQPYFMYLVPGLEFQERYLAYLERLFKVSILRIPHWGLSRLLRGASFRHPTAATATLQFVRIRHVEAWLRKETGIQWMATGEKAIDSLERNAYIRKCDGIDDVRQRIYPLAYWNHAAVFNYLKSHGIALPASYSTGRRRSFGSLWYDEVAYVRERHPADFERIKRVFPLIEAQLMRHQLRKERHGQETEAS